MVRMEYRNLTVRFPPLTARPTQRRFSCCDRTQAAASRRSSRQNRHIGQAASSAGDFKDLRLGGNRLERESKSGGLLRGRPVDVGTKAKMIVSGGADGLGRQTE
jgi:hypothetical protein